MERAAMWIRRANVGSRQTTLVILTMLFAIGVAGGLVAGGGLEQRDFAVKVTLFIGMLILAVAMVAYRPALFPFSAYIVAVPFDAILQIRTRPREIARMLTPLYVQPTRPAEALVVDQSTLAYDLEPFPELVHLHEPALSGLTAARNPGPGRGLGLYQADEPARQADRSSRARPARTFVREPACSALPRATLGEHPVLVNETSTRRLGPRRRWPAPSALPS
jgi:hypothetical protein